MKLLVAILIVALATPALTQPAFRPASATEVFNLRSQCAELGQKFLDELIVGPALSQTLTSHYDPRSNHCYGDVLIKSNGDLRYSNRRLIDLQGSEMLAFAKIVGGQKARIVFGRLSNMKDDLG